MKRASRHRDALSPVCSFASGRWLARWWLTVPCRELGDRCFESCRGGPLCSFWWAPHACGHVRSCRRFSTREANFNFFLYSVATASRFAGGLTSRFASRSAAGTLGGAVGLDAGQQSHAAAGIASRLAGRFASGFTSRFAGGLASRFAAGTLGGAAGLDAGQETHAAAAGIANGLAGRFASGFTSRLASRSTSRLTTSLVEQTGVCRSGEDESRGNRRHRQEGSTLHRKHSPLTKENWERSKTPGRRPKRRHPSCFYRRAKLRQLAR